MTLFGPHDWAFGDKAGNQVTRNGEESTRVTPEVKHQCFHSLRLQLCNRGRNLNICLLSKLIKLYIANPVRRIQHPRVDHWTCNDSTNQVHIEWLATLALNREADLCAGLTLDTLDDIIEALAWRNHRTLAIHGADKVSRH